MNAPQLTPTMGIALSGAMQISRSALSINRNWLDGAIREQEKSLQLTTSPASLRFQREVLLRLQLVRQLVNHLGEQGMPTAEFEVLAETMLGEMIDKVFKA